jgi:hypothetical protein
MERLMTQEISKTIPTEGVEVSRRNLLTRIAPAAGVAAVLGIAASPSLALAKANSPGGETLLFYNGSTGLAVTGKLNSDGTFTQFNTYNLASTWTHIVGVGGMILFYDANTGAGTSARLDSNGVLTILKSSATGFSPGWTTVMESNGLLFFYNSNTGVWASCSIDVDGNVIQLHTDRASTGWSIITSNY